MVVATTTRNTSFRCVSPDDFGMTALRLSRDGRNRSACRECVDGYRPQLTEPPFSAPHSPRRPNLQCGQPARQAEFSAGSAERVTQAAPYPVGCAGAMPRAAVRLDAM